MKNNKVFKAVSLSMALAAVMAVSPISNVHADDAAKDKKATKASEEKVLDGFATEAEAIEAAKAQIKQLGVGFKTTYKVYKGENGRYFTYTVEKEEAAKKAGATTEAKAKEKSNKKVKASEKDAKAYEALKKARYNNTVKVRAAQLLIQIAPNRVKEVRGQLDSLIKDSQELVKKS